MKKTARRIFTTSFLIMMALSASAQKGVESNSPYGHGEDSIRCVRNASLFSTYFENKDYEMAVKFWRSIYNECPASSKNIYIKGEAMFKELFRKSQNKAYIDTILLILSKRQQYFNEVVPTDLRKSIALYELGGNEPEYARESYNYIIDVMKTSPQSFDHTYSTLYMAVAAKCYSMKVIPAEEVISAYSKAMESIDLRLAKKPDDARYLEARKNIDAVFKSSGAATCTNLEELFTGKVEQNPNDIALLKKVLDLLVQTGCTESELYFKAATNLYRSERSSDAATKLAEMNYARKRYNDAEHYYVEAIELQNDPKIKSGLLTKLATLELTSDNKQAARDYAKNAYSLDNSNGNALFIIAESYAGARIGESFENQTVYWVVVDYLNKAKTMIRLSKTRSTNE